MPPTCARHLLRDVRRGMVHPNEPMNAPLHIAPLTAADLAAACALDPTDTGCRGRLLWHLHTPYAQALKAEQGAQLLGHACGLVHGRSGWVRHLHTAPHTTEVAPALLAALVEWMEAHGAHSQVAIAQPGAEAPYTACGFEESGSLLHYTHGHFLEATRAEVVDLARSFAWPLGTLLFGALVLMGVIRPAIKAMGTAPVAGATIGSDVQMNQLDALESDTPERPQLTGPGSAADAAAQVSAGEKQLEDARQLTRDNPAAVANIIKAWMNGEAPA